jgi:hypothetical protein
METGYEAGGSAEVPGTEGGGPEGEGVDPLGQDVDDALDPFEPAGDDKGRRRAGDPAKPVPDLTVADHVDQTGLVLEVDKRDP